jgi:uncharacterized membrane protein
MFQLLAVLLFVGLVLFYVVVVPLKLGQLSTRLRRVEEELRDRAVPAAPAPAEKAVAPEPIPAPAPPPAPAPAPAPVRAPAPSGPDLIETIGAVLRRNIFAAAGIALLLLGVSFLFPLIKGLISPPVRLALASALGAVLVALGYFRARSSRDYGQMLEGGGMAVLYLTLYAAYRLYGFVPAAPSFAGFVLLSAATVALSLAQNAKPLAFVGFAGAYAAPLLVTFVGGNLSVVLAYCFVLALAAALLGMLRAWREVNLLAFASSALISAVACASRAVYVPFVLSEVLLVAYFVLYTALPVAMAERHGRSALHDFGLLFGMPVVGLLVQEYLVDYQRTSIGISLAIAGGLYSVAWLVVQLREWDERLGQCLFWLALGCLTLAVPVGLSQASAQAFFAVEGAVLVVAGARLERHALALTGLALQALAGALALGHLPYAGYELDALPAAWVAGAGLVSAWHLRADAEPSRRALALGWAVAWVYLWALTLIWGHIAPDYRMTAALGFATLASAGAELLGAELKWTGLRRAVFALPLFWLGALALAGFERRPVPEARDLAHIVALAAAYGASYWAILRQRGEGLFPGSAWQIVNVVYLHAAIAALTLELYRFVTPSLYRGDTVALVLSAPTVVALAAFSGVRPLRALLSPKSAPMPGDLMIPALAAAGIFVAAGAALPQDVSAATPMLNPSDWLTLAAGAALLAWVRAYARAPLLSFAVALYGSSVLLMRWTGFAAGSHCSPLCTAFDVTAAKAALSLYWAAVGLALILRATARAERRMWMVGAGLLGVVFVKLLLFDMADVGAVARVVSFIGVGIFYLAVGWLSPLPPAEDERR